MRPFTRLHWVLARLVPAAAGMTVAGFLTLAVLEPRWGWIVAHGLGLLLLVAGLLARRHGRRRWQQMHQVAGQRGWRRGHVGWDVFTESEVAEIGLIHGPWFEHAIRELDALRRGVEEG